MITEMLLSGLFGIADILLGLLPDLEWSINTSAWSAAGEYLSMICYMLPLNHIIGIIIFLISLGTFRIGVAFLKFILGFIPFV